MKKYDGNPIALLIVGVFIILGALIFFQVQGPIIPFAVAIVLIVLIVVIGVRQPDGIAEIFRAIWSGLAEVIQAASQLRKQSE